MNGIFTLGWSDLAKGVVVAVFTGAFLPIAAAVQTPGFSIATVNWESVLVLAVNGAIIGFVGYVGQEFLSNKDGKFAGIVG